MFILATAKSFAWLITLERIPELLGDSLLSVTTNPNIVLIFICIGLLLIGTIESAFALMIGLITPPIGTSLYIVADVAGISFAKMSKATIVFVIPMVVVLLLITLIPELVLFLPKFFGYSG
jgi:TRAP-type C4-dicarboxylate transport system permease large subunit